MIINMSQQAFDINKLRVAAPCSVPWETMTGDDRVRRCNSCELSIYNISEMTASEVRNLIEQTEGRVCARLYKRADGSVITKDCPVGLRRFYKRTAQFAGAALSTIFALFSFGFGQSNAKNEKTCKTSGKIVSVESRNLNLVEGTITNSNCAIVPGAKITLINVNTKREYQVTSNKKGYYRILLNAPGLYQYKAEFPGFLTYGKTLDISNNESLQINASLEVASEMIGIIVLIDEEIPIDPKSSSNTFRITRKMMEKQP